MKKLLAITVIALALAVDLMGTSTHAINPFKTAEAEARIKYISGYTTSSGQYRSGHYRDTSNDGNPYNNANYLGYND